MAKLKFQATEMRAAKVDRISLVARGATRIPFRVIKEDSTMKKSTGDLDLAGVFVRKREQQAAPVVTGVITMKSEDESFDALKEQVAAAGFSVDNESESEEDDITVVAFQQGDEEPSEDHTVIKMTPELAVVVKGFSPYNVDMNAGDSSFEEACAAQGFYPGLSTMVDVMRNSIYSAVTKGDDPKEAAQLVSKMFDEAKTYCVSLVNALPAKAFKLEAIEASGDEEGEEEEGEEGDEETVEGSADGGDDEETVEVGEGDGEEEEGEEEPPKKSAVKKAACPEGVSPKRWEAMSPADRKALVVLLGPKEIPKEVTKAAKVETPVTAEDFESLLADLATGLKSQLKEALTPVSKSVTEIKDSMTALTTRVKAAEGVAKAAHEAVSGTVLGSEEDDHVAARKTDHSAYRGRDIDTAFSVRRRPGQ